MRDRATLDTGPQYTGLRLYPQQSAGSPDDVPQSPFDGTLVDRVRSQVAAARSAQVAWGTLDPQVRLRALRRMRLLIASDPCGLASTVSRANVAETLAAEVLPLLDACRFLEESAAGALREKKIGRRGRPMWLWGNSVTLRREPLGLVLIIGASNYPLMLAGIQLLQALAAGNAVLVKPAPDGSRAMQSMVSAAISAGVPEGLVQVLPEDREAATESIRCGVDKVFLTGSAATGRTVSRELADSTTPSVMELSGCDAVFVLEDADLELVCDCLLFGLTLNGSRTCMAPRRVFATDGQVEQILRNLQVKLAGRAGDVPLHAASAGSGSSQAEGQRALRFAAERIREAVASGAELVHGSFAEGSPAELSGVALLDRVNSGMAIAQCDLFAPVLSFIRVSSAEHALEENSRCPYALSASVFGTPARCQEMARRISAGCIVVNDMIVPSADPRVPFGGRGSSGYGVTRGEAGLLEMTQLKAVVASRRWFKPHLQSPTAVDADVMDQLIRLEHSAHPLQSLRVIPKMISAVMEQVRIRRRRQRL